MTAAILLVAHGSRDPRSQSGLQDLAEQVRSALGTVLVGTAVLELAVLPLHQQIGQFADLALASGCDRIRVVPLFLLPGVHVMEDLPAEVALAQAGCPLPIELSTYLGNAPGWEAWLQSSWAAAGTPLSGRILLAHGSRRAGSQLPIAQLADRLQMTLALWSVPPTLATQVEKLAQSQRSISVLPYFLFAGGITDAIAQTLSELAAPYPGLQLHLGSPIASQADFATWIAGWLNGQRERIADFA